MGQLVFQATLGGAVNLVGPNTASTFNLNVPAVSSTIATLAAQTFAGTQTFTVDAVVNGLTVGRGAGSVATNTAVGASALASTSSGFQNAAIGANAAQFQTNNNNTAVGYNAMVGVTGSSSGGSNVAVGSNSLAGLLTGNFNVAVGQQALVANTTASNNTAVGYQAAYSTTTGDGVTAVGMQSMQVNTTGKWNTSVGYVSLQYNTTGNYNTAVGHNALNLNTTADYNTAIGQRSLQANTTGSFNTGLGVNSLIANTTGTYNVALGASALVSNTTGANNTSLGYQSGYSLTTNGGNTFLGMKSGYAVTGYRNTFVGAYNNASDISAGSAVTSGYANTILGAYSGNQGGLDIRTSSNYIVLSDGDGNPRAFCNGSGYWVFGGSSNLGSAQNSIFYTPGTTYGLGFKPSTNSNSPKPCSFLEASGVEVGSITTTGSATTYSTSSDYRLKNTIAPMTGALAKVAQLKPVTYKWNADNSDGQGFIAHELQAVVPDAVVGEKDAVDANGNPVYQGIDTSFLVATLTAALQELKAEFDAYKASHP